MMTKIMLNVLQWMSTERNDTFSLWKKNWDSGDIVQMAEVYSLYMHSSQYDPDTSGHLITTAVAKTPVSHWSLGALLKCCIPKKSN